MKNIEGKIERKNRGSAGPMFLGMFLGFIITIGLLVGIGFYAYYNLSAKWINDKFHTSIDLGSDDLNKLTIKTATNHAINLINNYSTYTLNNFQSDFGIKIDDKVNGIDISDLKSVPIVDIYSKLKDKFTQISADELKDTIDLSSANKILDKSATYYYNSTTSKLYKNDTYVNEVTFNYTVEGSKIKIKSKEFDIVTNKVDIQLKYLPLNIAFAKFSEDLNGDNITLGELEEDYDITLPEMFDSIDRNTAINNLETEIDNLKIAALLGYTIDGDKVYTTEAKTTQVTGVIAIISKLKVSELSEGIDDYTVAEILGYTIDADTNMVYTTEDKTTEVTGIMAVISKNTLENIDAGIDSLTLKDVFSNTSTGILSLIPATTLISNVPTALVDAIKDETIDTLISVGVVDTPTNYDTVKDKFVNIGTSSSPNYVKVSSLKLADIMSSYFEIIGETAVDTVP